MDELELCPLTVGDLRTILDDMERNGTITSRTLVQIDANNNLVSVRCENNRVVLAPRLGAPLDHSFPPDPRVDQLLAKIVGHSNRVTPLDEDGR